MKLLRAAIKSCPPFINWFAIVSLTILVVQVLWLETIPALFPQAHEVGLVVESLLGANVAAYIFFVISYQLPQAIERNRVGPTIVSLIDATANRVMGFLQMIERSTTGALLDSSKIDRTQVETLFKRVSPSAVAPMARSALAPPLNWIAAMALHDEQCHESITRRWQFARFLDSELVALLNEIEFSRHSAGMKDVREYFLRPGVQFAFTDLHGWAENYWECYEAARRLTQYSAKLRSQLV